MEHHSVVTCFCLVPPAKNAAELDEEASEEERADAKYYLISAGWDQRLCIWDLISGEWVCANRTTYFRADWRVVCEAKTSPIDESFCFSAVL